MFFVADNLKRVQDRIARAALKAGRNSQDITLVVVTKTVNFQIMQELVSLGVKHVGENRVQDAKDKYDQLGGVFEWHMIGHLQKNKINHALEIFDTIHSVHSL